MKFKRIAAVATALGVVVAGGFVATAANAEPVSNSYVLVGSDTLQDVSNALVNGTTLTGSAVRVTAVGATLGSYDAFGTAAIQTKSGGPFFGRPANSGAGVNALRASISGSPYLAGNNNVTPSRVITGQVDIARSSSGPGTNANTNGLLSYVPFARDAVSYIYKGGTPAWANLTADQLKQIYQGTLTSVDGVPISPRLPQIGSGTRSFFLNAIGVTKTDDTTNTTAENDGRVLGAGEIIPFSVASWTAQVGGSTGVDTVSASGVALGTPISGVAPVSGSGASTAPNQAYYSNTTWGRDTYLVVETARVASGDPKYDAKLAALLDPSKVTSLTNFGGLSSTPGAVKRKFGFLAPSTTTPIRAYATL